MRALLDTSQTPYIAIVCGYTSLLKTIGIKNLQRKAALKGGEGVQLAKPHSWLKYSSPGEYYKNDQKGLLHSFPIERVGSSGS